MRTAEALPRPLAAVNAQRYCRSIVTPLLLIVCDAGVRELPADGLVEAANTGARRNGDGHPSEERRMDKDVEQQRITEARQHDRDFAALFLQLECPDAVASVDRGLIRLAAAIGAERAKEPSRH